MSKKKKIRVPLRKNRQNTPRGKGRVVQQLDEEQLDRLHADERLSRKGDITRHRTIISEGDPTAGQIPLRDVDPAACLAGRVLSPRGGGCLVESDQGRVYDCAVRRLLKSLATDERTSVAAGDRVLFRPTFGDQGVIERIEPRRGILMRKIRGRKHVLAANVDQVLIVGSADEPALKPSLIDRYLISAAAGGIRPLICINKIDLVDLVELEPVLGTYAQLGYEIIPTSIADGTGIARLKTLLSGNETVLAGQSGVGKTSLINALEPGLDLRTLEVAVETGKRKHTTTSASLLKLSFAGWIVDTPGVRQMELWDVEPQDVSAYFVEFHPFLRQCRFSYCSHIHEGRCGVKRAVVRGLISHMRYESYCRIRLGDGD